MEKTKPGLAVLIALKAKKKDEDSGDRHLDSAQELLDAIKKGDVKLFSELLKNYVESCIAESDQPKEEDEDSEGWTKA